MAKAINWPAPFRDELIAEPEDKRFCALRLGRLYFDNAYWTPGEQVLIRANHRIIRKAVIDGEMKCCPLRNLEPADYGALKSSLNTMEDVIAFLSKTYEQAVTPETEVTVVYYRNLPLDPELLEVQDDPHMD